MLTDTEIHDILNMHDTSSDVSMNENKEILLGHKQRIWQSSKDKRWRTHVYIEKKRHLIVKPTKLDLEKEIIRIYKENADNPTVQEIYLRFLNEKIQLGISSGSVERYERVFKSYLEEFGEKKVKKVIPNDLKNLFIDIVNNKEITSKEFSNIKCLVKEILIYAKGNGYIDWAVTNEVEDYSSRISNSKFKNTKKDLDELVFTDAEIELIKSEIDKWGYDIINLAILLDIKTGMRPGELVALKPSDIVDDAVNVTKTEISRRVDGHTVYDIKDTPKTKAGERIIGFPGNKEETRQIIEQINSLNPDGEFLFEINGKRINQKQVRDRLVRLCKKAGITPKSTNKIRKTYASVLHEKQIPDAYITTLLGHTDISTTQRFYIKNRLSDSEVNEQLKKVDNI